MVNSGRQSQVRRHTEYPPKPSFLSAHLPIHDQDALSPQRLPLTRPLSRMAMNTTTFLFRSCTSTKMLLTLVVKIPSLSRWCSMHQESFLDHTLLGLNIRGLRRSPSCGSRSDAFGSAEMIEHSVDLGSRLQAAWSDRPDTLLSTWGSCSVSLSGGFSMVRSRDASECWSFQ